VLQQAAEIEALFGRAHAAALRLAASFTIGEYLLPDVMSPWKRTHPDSQVRLDIANTPAVLDAVAGLEVDVGFIEATRTHLDLLVHHWRADELVVVALPSHPWAPKRVTARQLSHATWIVREPGSGTREATNRWLVPALGQVTVEMELGSNEAVKRAVASGLGLGCLSHHAVADALAQGWLVKLRTPLVAMRRALSIVVHKSKPLGSASQDFLKHCMAAESGTPSPGHRRGSMRGRGHARNIGPPLAAALASIERRRQVADLSSETRVGSAHRCERLPFRRPHIETYTTMGVMAPSMDKMAPDM
jgi:DNA-binding transcriptional LysR family regulator